MNACDDAFAIGTHGSAIARRMATVVRDLRARAARIRAVYARWRRAADTRAALRALDDRALGDLGLSRDEIASIAAEVAGDAERTRVRAAPRANAQPG